MKARIVCGLALVLGMAIVVIRAEGPAESEAIKSISDGERQWAEAVVTGDTALLDRILADDLWALAPDGTFHGKAAEIEQTRQSRGQFVSNHVTEVKVRLFGESAVAQGSESFLMRTGDPKSGRYVWTDTWVKRGGRWQVVASADILAPEEKR